ncbi:conserved hypothetical protein [Perkinsus marinus ATCC 50983]|uniref:AAA+ ATPase domain-containing protein n=1 Tax=Perkinsus marinus (strain ATCC 50983 / TXsc) TaxID=423536 RepID=C5L3U6_PERM5|nr:conserved hypothetical protein [Perkinsus marinus ATCC 50983]EER08675.1 conserved hypothetical protein [Perkinsus marinus ATCC 50983]|eukprot:XP_002776859.1 conserved hypothetical protein [Perkinsus marinus ATCC 50983]
MSNKAWQHRWADAMTELLEQIRIEHLPAAADREDAPILDVGFQPTALVYAKYLQLYTKIEDIYDQMIHPQKRIFIRQVMEAIIVRVLELKEQLIFFNPRHRSRFVALDEILADLKMNPEDLDWKFPRYLTRDTERADWIEIRSRRIEHWQKHFGVDRKVDDLDDHSDQFHIPFTLDQAIRLIQRNERGRAGIQKATMIGNWRAEAMKRERLEAEGVDTLDATKKSVELLEVQREAATRIAATWKMMLAKRHVRRMREEEYVFLGMVLPSETPAVDHVVLSDEVRRERKQLQEDAEKGYEIGLAEELEWGHRNKGEDLRSEMLEERREWILEVRKQTGAFPVELEAFYTRFEVPDKVSVGVHVQEEVVVKGKKDEKKATPKKKGGDKKTSKKSSEPAELVETHDVGTSVVAQKLVEHLKEYADTWETRDESSNYEQHYDVELTRGKVFPVVEEEVQKAVDELIKEELANLKNMYEKAKKKKGKGKKGKKGKGKKEKKAKVKKWCAAVGTVTHREDCLPELVQEGLIRGIAPAHLNDFMGEFAYLGATMRLREPACPPPSAQMVKTLLVEHVCLPLASTTIRRQCNLTAKSILLYGPKGCGKSLLARIIATEVGATFIDISPKKIEGKYTQPKFGPALLVYKAFLVAQDNAPAVIYCDEIDEVFQAVKKGKKKGKATGGGESDGSPRSGEFVVTRGMIWMMSGEPASRIKKDFIAAIKQIKTGPESTDQDRIVFIGCLLLEIVLTNKLFFEGTSNPFGDAVDRKELIKAFDEKIWVSTPDFGTRMILWKSLMVPPHVTSSSCLNLTSLAHISEGYTTRSIKRVVDRVLSKRRLSRLEQRPLTLHEFIEPLSRCQYSWKEEYKKFKEFDYEASGDKARNLQMQEETRKMEAAALADEADKKKKK